MKLIVYSLVVSTAVAFTPQIAGPRTQVSLEMGYVPDGMSPEQYRKLRAKEQNDASKKKFGAFGPQSFTSRSLKSFQQEMEKGRAGHLMPMFNAKEKMKKGLIKQDDIPYMQRGGSWDNSDVKGAKKVKWNNADKSYDGGSTYVGGRLDWTGTDMRFGGPAARAKAQQAKGKGKPEPPKPKKLFGMF